jgi:CubicO group peptidase (beta-lactamase class C family)
LKTALSKRTRQYAIILASLLALLILYNQFIGGSRGGYSYRVPEQTDDGWETASLADVGMDEATITDLMNGLSSLDEHPIHGIVVIRDGRLVLEEYFSGEDLELTSGLDFAHRDFDRDVLHCQASATKSVTSILLGIAIDQGLIQGVEEKLLTFYPEHSDLNDSEKAEITLRHMLTMSSGFHWDEDSYSYDDPRNSLTQQFNSEDPVRYLLELPLTAQPGTTFLYSSGVTNVLGDVVRVASGETLVEFADQNLFTPLGIDSFDWIPFPLAPHVAVASSTLYLRPRDMAKIGQLYLRGGEWNGDRIVSQEWIAESTAEAIRIPPSENPIPGLIEGYGYQWWRGTLSNGDTETYFAAGWGGQFIFVLPEMDMVVVLTGGQFEGDYQGFYDLVNDHVLVAALGR